MQPDASRPSSPDGKNPWKTATGLLLALSLALAGALFVQARRIEEQAGVEQERVRQEAQREAEGAARAQDAHAKLEAQLKDTMRQLEAAQRTASANAGPSGAASASAAPVAAAPAVPRPPKPKVSRCAPGNPLCVDD